MNVRTYSFRNKAIHLNPFTYCFLTIDYKTNISIIKSKIHLMLKAVSCCPSTAAFSNILIKNDNKKSLKIHVVQIIKRKKK